MLSWFLTFMTFCWRVCSTSVQYTDLHVIWNTILSQKFEESWGLFSQEDTNCCAYERTGANIRQMFSTTLEENILWVPKGSADNYFNILILNYYGLWKVHILVLGVPNNRLTCMQGQKTLSLSYMHLFFTLLVQRLPNYSLNDSFFQTLPLRDADLRWLVDWSHFHFFYL